MGAWGTGIFQDDTACDIRDEYRQLLGDGLTAPDAKARVLEAYRSSFDDPDESGVAWLALAATQWKVGRLDPDTLAQAIQVIDSGRDLTRWNVDSKDQAKRQSALEKLRAQITSTQPPAKKLAQRKLCESRWSEGDLIGYRLPDDRLIIFCVIGHHIDKGGTYPVCELLDWIGEDVPAKDHLRLLEVMRSRADHEHTITQMMLVGLNRKWAKRLLEIEVRLKPTQKSGRSSVVHFKYLDQFLKNWFLIG